MIPHEYIEELNRRTDIVDLVGSYVQLKRKGRLYGGLCPFHSEKTPSFYVYPDTQSFYCFGCGAGGDAISFAKKINSIDYGEAVKMLAARAGMPEPQEDDKTGRMRSRILSMNREAARFFHACLNSTVEEARQARAYWRRRGLDDKTIVRFGLGYAPNDGQALYQFLRDKGYNQQELDASGLFKRSASGRIYCLFWKRVMTPSSTCAATSSRLAGVCWTTPSPNTSTAPKRWSTTNPRRCSRCRSPKRAPPAGSSSARAIWMSSACSRRASTPPSAPAARP